MVDPALFSLAYRMLGTHADAEDAVQDAVLRVEQRSDSVRDARKYLFRTTANVCVDRLREQKRRREQYVGPWLPEPIATEQLVELSEDLRLGFLVLLLGFLVLLDQLSPRERLVFVLRNAYDLSFAEIAEIADASEAACRQRFKRAKDTIEDASIPATPNDVQRSLSERLLDAMAGDDIERVVALLSEDAVVLTDGGGVVSAAIIPIEGRKRIAQTSTFLLKKARAEGTVTHRFVPVNGDLALEILLDGVVHSLIVVEGEAGTARRIYVMRNPHKLEQIHAAA